MSAFLFFPFMAVIFVVVIPLLIGVLVYRDAKGRGMDALVWALVAVLIPGFIGLIIYLIMRKDFGNLRCVKCSNLVRPDFATCPYCGNGLKGKCPSCGRPVEPGYRVCPNCAQELTPMEGGTYEAGTKGDNTLVYVLIAAVALPVLLAAGMFAASFMYASTGMGEPVPAFQEEWRDTRSILDDQAGIDEASRAGIEALVDAQPDRIHLIQDTAGRKEAYLAFRNADRLYYYMNLYGTDQGIYEIRINAVPGYDKASMPEYAIIPLGRAIGPDMELYLDDEPVPDVASHALGRD